MKCPSTVSPPTTLTTTASTWERPSRLGREIGAENETGVLSVGGGSKLLGASATPQATIDTSSTVAIVAANALGMLRFYHSPLHVADSRHANGIITVRQASTTTTLRNRYEFVSCPRVAVVSVVVSVARTSTRHEGASSWVKTPPLDRHKEFVADLLAIQPDTPPSGHPPKP